MSSDGFGGVACAGPRIQIGSAAGAEAGTVLTTEQQCRLSRERHFLTHHVGHVDRDGALGQRVEVRIVGRLGVGRKDRRVYVDVHRLTHLGETPSALTPHHAVDVPAPEVFTIARGLELTPDRHRTFKIEPQPLKRRIAGLELADGLDGTPLQVPNVHSQHSRLK
jgi:hypothetical protein